MRNFLAALCWLWVSAAFALTPSERVVLFSQTSYPPTLQYNFINATAVPSWISFSRAGNATMYDSTGQLTWAPANLLLNSDTLLTQTVTGGVAAGGDYILSFSGTGSVAISGGYTGTLAGTGVNDRVYLKFNSTTTSLTFTVTGSVTSAQLERVTYQTTPRDYIATTSAAIYGPRFDYDPSVSPAVSRGFLIEDARINSILQSQTFNTTWTLAAIDAFGSGSVVDAAVAPDGTTTADFVRPTTALSSHALLQAVTTTATTYAFTVYAKPGGYNFVFLFNGTLGIGRVFNISTGALGGTAGNSAPTSSSVTYVGNGWYRCQIVLTATAASNSWRIYPLPTDAASAAFAGDGVSGTYLWGAQLEAGGYATSYVSTTTGSVTRVADLAQITGTGATVSDAATGSAIVQTTLLQGSASTVGILGSGASRRLLYLSAGGPTNAVSFNGTTILTATIGNAGNYTTGPVRSAVAWTTTGRSLTASNGQVTSDSAALGTAAFPTVLGAVSVGANYLNGWVASMALYNTKLPNPVLKQKSQVGAPY